MKTKKVLFAVTFAAVTLLSGYNYVQNKSEVKLSDLALANVEALASGEGGGVMPQKCYKIVIMAEGVQTLYCQGCIWIAGQPSWVSGEGTCIPLK